MKKQVMQLSFNCWTRLSSWVAFIISALLRDNPDQRRRYYASIQIAFLLHAASVVCILIAIISKPQKPIIRYSLGSNTQTIIRLKNSAVKQQPSAIQSPLRKSSLINKKRAPSLTKKIVSDAPKKNMVLEKKTASLAPASKKQSKISQNNRVKKQREKQKVTQQSKTTNACIIPEKIVQSPLNRMPEKSVSEEHKIISSQESDYQPDADIMHELIIASLKQYWTIPHIAPPQTTCHAEITVSSQGKAHTVLIIESSGQPLFDASLCSALYRCSYPKSAWGKTITLIVTSP